eukprot:Awhi_evm1s4240
MSSLTSRRSCVPHPTGIPVVGLGVYQCNGKETYNAVKWALEAGYRHIDSATLYQNEKEVGDAVRDSKIPREEIFVTSKMWTRTPIQKSGFEDAIDSVNRSLEISGLQYFDLYLLHSPYAPENRMAKWEGLEQCVRDGKLKSIGVSNYGKHHLQELLKNCKIKPAVNQIEVHPFLTRIDLCNYCKENDIVVQAYSPLAKAQRFDDPTLISLAKKYGKSPAQIMLRWGLQKEMIILPKSVHKDRIVENTDVFGWGLKENDVKILDGLDEYFTT